VHISTGDLLRAEVSAETEIGNKAKEFMNAGRLVPDEIVTAVLFPSCTFTGFYIVFISFLRCPRNELSLFVDGDSKIIIGRCKGKRMASRWLSTEFCPSRKS
jgi:hypothetical protein